MLILLLLRRSMNAVMKIHNICMCVKRAIQERRYTMYIQVTSSILTRKNSRAYTLHGRVVWPEGWVIRRVEEMVPNDRKNKNGRIHNKNIIPYIYTEILNGYILILQRSYRYFITTIPYQPQFYSSISVICVYFDTCCYRITF